MKNFQLIFDAIFNGNIELSDILRFSKTNEKFIKDMIDYINSLRTNENKNKYFFIICYVIAFEDRDYNILEYLISIIGLDKLIEIVYEINYGDVFDRIITNIGSTIVRMNQHIINIIKSNLFMKLIEYYSEKLSLDEFKELLIKLFIIENNSFIEIIIEELFNFFTNDSPKIQPSFKLLDFLFENKERFRNFIRIFKNFFTDTRPYIPQIVREIIGSKETQDELFRNV